MILIFLLLQIIRIGSENFKNYCFQIFGYFQSQINIPFHADFIFVPNVLKLTTTLKENSYDSEIRVVQKESFILQKLEIQCTDNFVYHIPDTQNPIWSLEIEVSWGPEDFSLDYHTVIMKKDFEDSFHMLKGVKENTMIPVYLLRVQFPYLSTPQSQVHPLPEFNTKLRPLLQGESYCMSFFNREIKEFLIFSHSFLTVDELSEYYILSLRALKDNWTDISSTRFLVKIFLCDVSGGYDEKFRIFVDKTTKYVNFELSDVAVISYHIKKFVACSGTAVDAYRQIDFDFNNLEVKIQPLTQEMADQKLGILLYPSKPFERYCKARVPENIDSLKLLLIFEQISNDVVIYRNIRSFDRSAEEFGVLKVQPGTQEEYKNCLA